MYQFDKETNKSHDSKSNGSSNSNLLEFYKKQSNKMIIIMYINEWLVNEMTDTPFRSGFVHLVTSLIESLAKSLTGRTYSSTEFMIRAYKERTNGE